MVIPTMSPTVYSLSASVNVASFSLSVSSSASSSVFSSPTEKVNSIFSLLTPRDMAYAVITYSHNF